MDKKHLDELLKRYEAGHCTEEERQAVEKWYASYDNQDEHSEAILTGQQNQMLYANIVDRLKQDRDWHDNRKLPVIKRAFFRWVAAAAIIVATATIYLWLSTSQKEDAVIANTNGSRFKNDIAPGGNKAMLTLADGSQVILDKLQNGKIAQQGNVNILKLNPGLLAYDKSSKNAGEILYNTLSTPRGGQYEISLPDGSKAWLNASSSLRFPTSFSGKERTVELTGEAYFEIAKNKAMPFAVKVNDLTVEVLGTHFNVMAYANERAVKTTLLEGRVKVTKEENSSFLQVGQQATVLQGQKMINVINADTEETVAWKNNLFWFHNADIKTVMHQIERWYDVDVFYEGDVVQKFNGSIPMNLGAIKVFRILEETGGVHFKIDGRRISVLP
jgi:ferric-dicitrate binding protein FerR (iron transport regulator)